MLSLGGGDLLLLVQAAFWQCAQVPVISTTASFGAKPEARAAAARSCATGAAGILADRTAAVADQERHQGCRVMVMRAGEIGVAALDAMHEPVRHQEIERAIDRDRRRPRHRMRQFLDHLIGAERAMAGQQRLQHLAADRRQLLRPLGADPFRMGHRIRGAAVVVMVGCGKRRLGCGHQGPHVARPARLIQPRLIFEQNLRHSIAAEPCGFGGVRMPKYRPEKFISKLIISKAYREG